MQRTDLETDPAWADPDTAGPRRRRRWLPALVAGLLVLAGAYAGLAYYLSRTVPAQAVVGGVDVGGRTPEEAAALVESEAARIESEPVVVTVADASFQLEPDRAGLRIDTASTLEGITEFTLDPRALYEPLSGSFEREFVLAVDDEALTSAVAAAAESVDRAPVEGTVAFADGAAQVVQPVEGLAVDVAGTTERVAAVWPRETAVEGAGGPVEPETPASVFASFTTDFADKALAGPLTVRVGDGAFEVPAEQVATVLRVEVGGGSITPSVDEGEAVLAALTAPERTLALEPVVTEPKLTTEKARETLPKERISTFTTNYAPGQARNTNIKVAVQRLNGTYVPPGGQLSLNGILGQRTPDKGYVKAGIILNGRLSDAYGGGISQVSTTLYNAAYFAGVQFNEFQAHSFYIPRYPEGREATISWGTIDQRWTNNTKGGILVRAFATDTAVTVELWGTKTFDVESIKGPRRNLVEPKSIVDDQPGCVTQSPMPGFDVTVTRIIRQNGAEIKRENVSTHYDPEDKVTCTHPDSR